MPIDMKDLATECGSRMVCLACQYWQSAHVPTVTPVRISKTTMFRGLVHVSVSRWEQYLWVSVTWGLTSNRTGERVISYLIMVLFYPQSGSVCRTHNLTAQAEFNNRWIGTIQKGA